MGFQSRKKSQSQHSAEVSGLEQISNDHISETTCSKGQFFVCVIVATIDNYDEVSSKSEGVTWELFLKLVDLTWNDLVIRLYPIVLTVCHKITSHCTDCLS